MLISLCWKDSIIKKEAEKIPTLELCVSCALMDEMKKMKAEYEVKKERRKRLLVV